MSACRHVPTVVVRTGFRSAVRLLSIALLLLALTAAWSAERGAAAVRPTSGHSGQAAAAVRMGAALPRAAAAAAPINVLSFGATGNGVTDDAPALRRALAGATNLYVPAGTYLLKSYLNPRPALLNADFVFSLRSGQTIAAAPGAVFKMGDRVITSSAALWGGNVFLGDHVQDVRITGLTIDLNGAANLVPPGRTITGYGLYLYGAQRVVVDRVTMRNTPGQNYLVTQGGGSDITVRSSTFLNGGTSIPTNRAQTDFSALYFTATRVTVDRVRINHSVAPFTYSGGIELHGSYESVTNSYIRRSWPAVYIGPDSYSKLSVMQHTTVTGNSFVKCGRAIIFNAGGSGAISGVDITRNVFRLSAAPAFPSEPARGIDQDQPVDGQWTYHHIITGLTIAANDFTVTAPFSDAVIRLSQVHSATIQNNQFQNAAGGVLQLASSPWGTTKVLFTGNTVGMRNSPTAPAVELALDGSSTSPAVAAFATRGIHVVSNTFQVGTQAPIACGVWASWGSGAPVTDVVAQGNSYVNLGLPTCGSMAGRLGG